MSNLAALKQLNLERWHRCEILPARKAEVMKTAQRLSAPDAKARYQGVSDRLAEIAVKDSAIVAVPWWLIAIISEREYGGPPHWDRQLGQGDPLNQPSRHVPRGMGPYLNHPDDKTPGFDAWTRCCVDVLINSAPFVAKRPDQSIGGTLVTTVLFNGTGYEDFHHEASPYDWGATNIEQWGKYVADGRFDPHVWDTQLGCAAMLKGMMELDPTIKVDGA